MGRRGFLSHNEETEHGSSRIAGRARDQGCRSGRRGGAGRGADRQGHHHSEAHEDCIRACQECSRSCNETFRHCYEQLAEGKKDHATALHLVADCAKFCNLSSDLVANGSPLMVYSCAAVRRGVQGVRGRVRQSRGVGDEGLCQGVLRLREDVPGDGPGHGRPEQVSGE